MVGWMLINLACWNFYKWFVAFLKMVGCMFINGWMDV